MFEQLDTISAGERIARHSYRSGNIACNYAARADDRIVTDRDTRQAQRTTAYPDISAKGDRSAELEHPATLHRIARMIGREYLLARTNLRARTDPHWHYIEDRASKIEECALTQMDVVAIVAVERRPDRRTEPGVFQPFHQQRMALFWGGYKRTVVAVEPRSGACRVRDEFGSSAV